MNRPAPRPISGFVLVSLLALCAAAPALAAKRPTKAEAAAMVPERAAFTGLGEIVDCTDYVLMGNKGAERRTIQAANIDSGMPACFVTRPEGEVYLLLQMGGQARERFQPTQNFIGGGITIKGILFRKGTLQAVAINEIQREGGSMAQPQPPGNKPPPPDGAGTPTNPQ